MAVGAKYDVQSGDDDFSWGDPISVIGEDGKLTDPAVVVLELIAQYDAILGTAHLSLEEITPLVTEARQRGVQKILITHPFFKVPAGMNVDFLHEMARLGAIAEFGFWYRLSDVGIRHRGTDEAGDGCHWL